MALYGTLWNSIKQVLNGSIGVSKGGVEGSETLFSGEAHSHEFVDLIFGWLGAGRIAIVFFLFGLFLLLILRVFLFGFVGLFFNFGFRGRFLDEVVFTETWFMTTRKSVYLIPSLSSCSSSLMVFPLKMIFIESLEKPFSASIRSFRLLTCFQLPLRLGLGPSRWRRSRLSNF